MTQGDLREGTWGRAVKEGTVELQTLCPVLFSLLHTALGTAISLPCTQKSSGHHGKPWE